MEPRKHIMISTGLWLSCCFFWRMVLGETSADFGAWIDPRVGIVRNSMYLEGGLTYNTSGDQLPYSQGLLYNFSLCDSITPSEVKNGVPLNQLNESYTNAPIFVGGTMFADDNEFYTYGGLQYPQVKDFSQDKPILLYQIYGVKDQTLSLGPTYISTENTDVTNNVAYGAGVSVPRQSLAFYFSGLQAPSGGPISFEGGANDTASMLTSSMVQLDTSSPGDGVWHNDSLPSYIPPRAEASLSWVPAGVKGLLIAIGGITKPADINGLTNATDLDLTFLTNVSVYDIDKNVWYRQAVDVLDGYTLPQTMAQFCTVMVHPSDKTSFQIYAYGGYDGTYKESQAYSSIWALSVPKFRWYPISVPGDPNTRRMSHHCEMLDANTMIAVGGSIENSLPLMTHTFDIFDLNSLTWTGQYTPGSTANYTVPSVIANDINTAPMPSSINNALAAAFTNDVYVDAAPVPTFGCPTHHSSGVKASVIAPAVAVPVAVLIILAILLFWFVRRRKKAGRPVSWLSKASTKRGSGAVAIPKSDSESTHVNAYELANRDYFGPKRVVGNATEVSGTPITTPPMSLLGRGSPQPVDAPGSPHSGPSELPQSTHPTSTRDSMSLRDHHMHPVGYASDGVNSNWGDDRSAASRSEYAYPNMSARLFELPGTAQHRGLPDPLAASVVHPTRPHHERNASSLSETRPMPASPTPDEDARRSQAIDNLPSPAFSPTTPGAGTSRTGDYQGKFDEIFRDRQS